MTSFRNRNSMLPSSWLKIPLAEVISRISNGTTERQNKEGNGIPVTRIETISNGVINRERVGYISNVSDDLLEKYRLRYGDILFSHINSDLHLGKTALFKKSDLTLLHGMNLLLIRSNENVILSGFLNYIFQHYRLAGEFLKIAQHAVNQSSINQAKLNNLEIPLPPLPEQHRIVSKIEELFTKLDAGVEELRKAKARLKRYRQAVLKQGLEGKLTTEWRAVRKTESSLDISENMHGDSRGSFCSDPSTPFPVPSGWEWVRLSEISERIQIGPFGTQLHKQDYVFNGVPVINPSHIKDGAIIPDYELSVSLEKYRELENYILQEGDIIVGRRGEMGRCAMISSKESGWICGTGSLFVRPTKQINQRFLCWTLGAERVKRFLENESLGTTMSNLNLRIMKNIQIPLPSLQEQELIVREIEFHLSISEKLREIIDINLARIDKLRQCILHRAFEGKLIPQDPNDEPAEKLLERIRESAIKVPPTRKKRKSNGDTPNGK